MNRQENAMTQLRQAIERKIGHTLKTPKDFDQLEEIIFQKVHEPVSASTLRRFWGYQHDAAVAPRISTLDILSRFVGYDSWDDFLSKTESAEETAGNEQSSPATADSVSTSPSSKGKAGRFLLLALAALIAVTLFFLPSLQRGRSGGTSSSPDSTRILRLGQKFSCYDDYMKLFGLKSDEYHTYFVPLPEYPFIRLWAPHYKHPVWHNEGDSAKFLPTITVYWRPDDVPTDSASLAAVATINKERYIRAVRDHEILLAFMKNLVDTNYVFIGAYRLSATLSDTTRTVYRRVAEEIDLDHLEILERFRL